MPSGYVMPTCENAQAWNDLSLTVLVKLTEFGAAAPLPKSSKDDERAAALARRAQQGDYSEGPQNTPFPLAKRIHC